MAKKVNSFEGPESQMEQRKKIIFHLPATVTTTPHREPFVQLSALPDHSLLVTGQDGLISVWNQDLKLKKSKRILQENKQQTRNMKWILDSEIMLQYNKLIIGTCEREIRFYELSSFDPYCQIVGVETMPLHLGFSPRNKDEGILYFGDEKGCVNIIVASNMGEVLRIWAKCQPVEEIPTISINDIEDSSRVTFIRWKVHNDWVSQVRYISSIQSLVSSSNDGYNALVIGCVEETKILQKQLKDIFESSSIRSKRSLLSGNVPSRRNPWDESVFRVRKGIKTFDFCKERNILVTGGLDRTVRLWNLHVPGWPIGVLRGHGSPIMYLRIGDENTRIYSISADCTVMVWDIEDHSCLVRVISKASYIKGELDACYFSSHLKSFFVATDSLAVLRVQQNTQQSRLQSVSHNDPVTCCQHNKQLNQIVSCSEGSGIKTWDIFTGQLVFEVRSAHGSSPISCLAIDYNGKSMLTGGWDGSLKQWYYRSDSIGLKKILKPVNSMEEVIDCTYAELRNNRYIISVGCDSQIQVYPDQEEVTSRNPSPPLNWINTMKDGHKDEILCVTSFPPNLLATSSFDGEVVVWNLISGNIFCCLSDSKQVAPKDITDALVINKVVFIQSRIEQKNESAVLIASGPRGQITFWNIFGGGRVFGRFPGSQYSSVVTDMAISEDDSLLCAADLQFSVYIWNISQYALHGLEDKPPTLLHCWRAHLCDITSVIPMSKHGLVVTSSMDCTVKLWSLQGEHIGTFGQNELWDITKKESWKEQSIVSSLNTHKSPPKPLTGTNSSLSIESNSIISEVTVSSEPIDKEIVEELKNLNILKAQNRVQQVGSKTTDIQQVCGRVNSYQSLKIFDLLYVPPTIRKPNPAAEINDPYDLSI